MQNLDPQAARTPRQIIVDFEAECASLGLAPLDVLAAAGIHRSAWFRWKSGAFAPSFDKWEGVQKALREMKTAKAA